MMQVASLRFVKRDVPEYVAEDLKVCRDNYDLVYAEASLSPFTRYAQAIITTVFLIGPAYA